MLKLLSSALAYTAITLSAVNISTSALAQTLPSAADIDRVKPNEPVVELHPMNANGTATEQDAMIAEPPEDAKLVKITLRNITVTGVTKYDQQLLRNIYQDQLNHEITLDKIWEIAGEITKKYRADGYFLSRAYVPAQQVADGNITISVVEGYIGDVTIDPKYADNKIIKSIISTIKSERPASVKTLEREHLLLSDLPGMSQYQGILTPMKNGPEGAVQLIFSPRDIQQKNKYIGLDNMGSRYLGPYEVSASWHGQLVPLQETSVSGTASLPTNELGAINVSHEIPITQDLKVELTAGYTTAEPGYTIKARDIESEAVNSGISLNYQIIRQRQENLSVGLGLDGRNSESTIIGTELTKDRIRAARLSATYDTTDDWLGYNVINVTLSHGLDILGASDSDDLNISRDGAKPNFTKAEIQLNRLQAINQDWSTLLTLNAQKASGSLFSSEEFGFGGQTLGRAYDPSEISGDDGIAAGVELRYQSLPVWEDTHFQPFAFYDIGKVWNKNSGQEHVMSASSTGIGMRFQHTNGISGTLQFALPLTKSVDAPLYGSNGSNPQFSFQIGYSF